MKNLFSDSSNKDGSTSGINLDEFKLDNNTCYYDHIKNYSKEHIDYFKFMNEVTGLWLSKNLIVNEVENLLNVGCGKTSGQNTLKEIGIKNIVGIDSDPICWFPYNNVGNKIGLGLDWYKEYYIVYCYQFS